MDKWPLVSVIVPVYGGEKYIYECVDSVLNQTYHNIECILVDGDSPDNCPQICEEYAKKDKRVKVIHKKNRGLSDDRNAGFRASKGEYITFVDSDDVISSDMIQYLYKLCIKYNVLLAQCNYIKEKAKFDLITNGQEQGILVKKERCMVECISNIAFCVSWGKLFHRTILERVSFPIGKTHEDVYTTHLFFEAIGKIVFTKKRLYYYRQHKESLMFQTRSKPDLEELKADITREKFFKSKDYSEAYKIQMQYIMNLIIYLFKNYYTYLTIEQRKCLYKKFGKRFVTLIKMDRLNISIDYWLFYAKYMFVKHSEEMKR